MADHYAREAARIAGLALADSAGFDAVQTSCGEILADLLLRYVHEVGAASHHYAELAGRSETNAVDVAMALNDMGTSIGQLRDFMHNSSEVPFEHNISAFPLRKKSRPPPSFYERGETAPDHIPPWLPAFPDRHTYQATPVYPGQEKDPQKRQQQLTEQRQLAETATVRLQARLAADSNLLLAAKLPAAEEAEEAAPAAAGGQPALQQGAPAAAAAPAAGAPQGAAGTAAARNPFFMAPWGEVETAGQQGAAAAGAAQAAQSLDQGLPPASAGPTAEWEQAVWEAGAPAAGGGFAAQQLFATQDWKAQQQRRARIATSGRAVREAFGEAYDEQAAARAGKRQKRGAAGAAAAAAAAAADPTRARVETLLAASSQGVVRRAAAVAAQDVIQETI
ncbi:hypothetical protein COHA_003557 [Chlorella ohadii]|uniref:Transcription initiation factor TFIID subunit 8 n=1 Tax=Chlorella ohadii TaxID=2649997 RepID=A0AAD5H3R1_9CHLO|nr:hypothetical protein COHA_003557 [Chlorella ohadii]